ncbi:alpha mannosyltransferase mnt3 [Fusarium heterosporum]|uniref:Alpha mannosyltransferase mnt3 n=1 Tax=Fusarium heterosporum TaxID=42747 RepID=A0A8H5X1H2_FUSHE|nr:alpha mannosyltransferase mnt3 [Fusarium heterosporum]
MEWPAQLSIDIISSDSPSNINRTAKYYIKNPIQAPYEKKFWETGQRAKRLGQWLQKADSSNPKSKEIEELYATTEQVAQKLFPFLQNSPLNEGSKTPLADLRRSYKRGSRGIVIPVGGGEDSVRFASHLIVSLRQVLKSKLPIQIAYAGDGDLPEESRKRIQALKGANDIEFLDVWSVFDDSTLKLNDGGWAIKVFALLASKFEQAILLDADAVFMQEPEQLFSQKPYVDKGAYLFHDRLLWQYLFQGRHKWWADQIKDPSAEMEKSRVWMEEYAEECDSGVVVVDKSRISILVGLLHVAWQNTYDVRKEVTYRMGHGDKESWWLGLEVSGSTYEFEAHYGSVIGWGDSPLVENVTQVCSFAIAHLDTEDRLLWYNGGLLMNKRENTSEYRIPSYWMMDGRWRKGRTANDMSCMKGLDASRLSNHEKRVLGETIEVAKEVDKALAK